jgi:hypothetical protein
MKTMMSMGDIRATLSLLRFFLIVGFVISVATSLLLLNS